LKGLHVVCGWKTRMDQRPGMGQYFAERLRQGDTIGEAWIEMSRKYPRINRNAWSIARVFGADHCEGDSLRGTVDGPFSPIALSRDPGPGDQFRVLYQWARMGE